MLIRLFQPQDATPIAQLFHDTVRNVNICDYSPSQVAAWAPENIHFTDWAARCQACWTYVADDQGTIAGFGQLESTGHIDCFYIHTAYQRQGVGRQIYQAIEAQARALDCDRLFTEASITAKPFFQHLGFTVVRSQLVSCRGEQLTNYVMEKSLR
ncbi:GNAT family N-acetyltransferase [filamentous cyanobacterium LEGE 11480]|uniref:GNAT family N-acetyltransferase n=2 Tax=Romeriopsis TaxID=2992131 RepID=A0A928VL96_9CYAN|nr:GNAT family N-acetyltransferase [Romeriopsis navalis LEGE 11480]